MNWDHDGQRWTLSAAPRYAVGYRADDDYPMLIDGHEVDSAATSAQAQGQLEARFEYEEHGSELELARLRLRQARERLEERYPRAARDAELSCALEGLGDALGTGPEASEPAMADAVKTDRFRQQLSPDLWIVTDAAANVVFEVTTPAGRILRRVAVSPATVALVMGDAAMCARLDTEEADVRRLAGPDEKRRSEGRLTKREAVEWLIAKGPASRQRAVHMVRELGAGAVGSPLALGMRFDGIYWVVPRRLTQAEAVEWVMATAHSSRPFAVKTVTEAAMGGTSYGMRYEDGYWVVPA